MVMIETAFSGIHSLSSEWRFAKFALVSVASAVLALDAHCQQKTLNLKEFRKNE